MSLSLNDLPVEIVHGILLRVEVESVVRLSALISRDALRAVEAETAWCFVHIADCCQPALSCGSDFPLVASLRCPEK